MSDHEVLQRIKAFAEGAPVPRGTVLPFRKPRPYDLRLAFVRMGGESAPWGVAWQSGRAAPKVLTTGEARDRNAVAQMMEEFAPVLLAHLGHPDHAGRDAARGTLWLPGPTHLEMLHHVAIAYSRVTKADEPRRSTLLALSRAATWLFRESQRAGQAEVVDAAWALRSSYAYPADDLRQAHLGFLLAWLKPGTRDERLALAQQAERASVATTLDPVLERDELERRVEKLRGSVERDRRRLESEIGDILRRELLVRLALNEAARAVLTRDPRRENPGLDALGDEANRAWQSYQDMEAQLAAGKRPWVPNALADHGPIAPARAMRWAEAHETVTALALAHHDRDLQTEWVADGEAIAGRVISVRDEGAGTRAMIPVWSIESPGHGPLKLRPGATVVVAGEPGRTAEIRRIEETKSGRRVEVEITNWKRAREDLPSAIDPRQKGRPVVLLEGGHDPIGLLFRSHFGERNGPGSWLTRKLARTPEPEEA